MKKVLVGLGVVAAVTFFAFRRGGPAVAPAPVAGASPSEVKLPQARFQALQQAPRAKLAPPKETDPACAALWTELRDLDVQAVMADSPKADALPKASRCKSTPDALKPFHDQFADDCRSFFEARDKLPHDVYIEAAAKCQAALGLYRAHLTDWLTRDRNPEEISDLKVLSDKLLANFESNPEAAARLAERMLELDPTLSPAAKAAAMSRFFDAQKRAAGKPDDPLWRRFDDAETRLSRMDGAPPKDGVEMRLMGTLLQHNGDPDKLVTGGQDAASRHPTLPNGPYYAAWGEFRRGNGEAATRWLAEALRRAPNDARLLETQARLQRGEADPFRAVLSTSLSPGT